MDLPEPTPRFLAVLAVEVVLYLGGIASLIAWWKQRRIAVGTEARAEIGTLNLALSDLLLAAFTIVVGALLLQSAVGALAQVIPAALSPEAWMVAQGCGFQLGLLSGALLGHRLATASNRDRVTSPSRSPLSTTQACAAGGLLFLASLPLILTAALAWKAALRAVGLPTDQQDMVDLVRNADAPGLLALIAVLAVVLAPVAEELVFRAGLFRYLRTRVPRAIALVAPALLFAALHANLVAFVPLAVFGVLLALAYEQSGRLVVPVVAHALFNLHTLALVLSGVEI
jgi:membrane protease YdiL (CAAX protease family)